MTYNGLKSVDLTNFVILLVCFLVSSSKGGRHVSPVWTMAFRRILLSFSNLTKWQEQWTSCTKGAISKLFFPYIKDRFKTKLPVSTEFTAMVMGHSLTKSYLHRFMFISNSTCPWQTKRRPDY